MKESTICVHMGEYCSINLENKDIVITAAGVTSCVVLIIKNLNQDRICTHLSVAHISLPYATKENLRLILESFKDCGGILDQTTSIQIMGGLKDNLTLEFSKSYETMSDYVKNGDIFLKELNKAYKMKEANKFLEKLDADNAEKKKELKNSFSGADYEIEEHKLQVQWDEDFGEAIKRFGALNIYKPLNTRSKVAEDIKRINPALQVKLPKNLDIYREYNKETNCAYDNNEELMIYIDKNGTRIRKSTFINDESVEIKSEFLGKEDAKDILRGRTCASVRSSSVIGFVLSRECANTKKAEGILDDYKNNPNASELNGENLMSNLSPEKSYIITRSMFKLLSDTKTTNKIIIIPEQSCEPNNGLIKICCSKQEFNQYFAKVKYDDQLKDLLTSQGLNDEAFYSNAEDNYIVLPREISNAIGVTVVNKTRTTYIPNANFEQVVEGVNSKYNEFQINDIDTDSNTSFETANDNFSNYQTLENTPENSPRISEKDNINPLNSGNDQQKNK